MARAFDARGGALRVVGAGASTEVSASSEVVLDPNCFRVVLIKDKNAGDEVKF